MECQDNEFTHSRKANMEKPTCALVVKQVWLLSLQAAMNSALRGLLNISLAPFTKEMHSSLHSGFKLSQTSA
jgi:hypothetical protein